MADQQSRTGILGRIASILALLFFLVVLPVGSYIYLKKGYEYQKEAMKDLRKEQRLTSVSELNLLLGEAPKMEIGESYYLLGLLPSAADKSAYAEVLKNLHAQFDIPENLELWTLFSDGTASTALDFQNTYEIPADTSQLVYWGSDQVRFNNFVDQLALYPEELKYLEEGLIVLLDDSLYIRQAYPYQDAQRMQQLVERTAILLPERSKPKPELRREAEL